MTINMTTSKYTTATKKQIQVYIHTFGSAHIHFIYSLQHISWSVAPCLWSSEDLDDHIEMAMDTSFSIFKLPPNSLCDIHFCFILLEGQKEENHVITLNKHWKVE